MSSNNSHNDPNASFPQNRGVAGLIDGVPGRIWDGVVDREGSHHNGDTYRSPWDAPPGRYTNNSVSGYSEVHSGNNYNSTGEPIKFDLGYMNGSNWPLGPATPSTSHRDSFLNRDSPPPSFASNTGRININDYLDPDGQVNLTVNDGIHIEDTGGVTIRNLCLETRTGRLTVGAGVRATAAKLVSRSGEVNAERARFDSFSAETRSGAIRAPQATGESTAQSQSGAIYFDESKGDFAGSIICNTETGSVYYNGENVGKSIIRPKRGDW